MGTFIVTKRYFSKALVCLLLFSSCTKITDLKPSEPAEVVVECVLTTDNIQNLRLSLTENANNNDYNKLGKANIVLVDNTDKTTAGYFIKGKDNNWSLTYKALPGHDYLLTISIEDREIITAKTRMPDSFSLHCEIQTPDYNMLFDDFESTLPRNEVGVRYKTSDLPSGPVWVTGINYDVGSDEYSLAEEIATSLDKVDIFNCSDKTFFNEFFSSLYRQQGPFSTYPYSLYYYVEGQPIHEKFLRIVPVNNSADRSSKEPDGFFSIAGSFKGMNNLLLDNIELGYVLFESLSRDYDLYLKDVLSEQLKQRNNINDYSSLFHRYYIHSNIENGIGIFGAKIGLKAPWINIQMTGRQWLLEAK